MNKEAKSEQHFQPQDAGSVRYSPTAPPVSIGKTTIDPDNPEQQLNSAHSTYSTPEAATMKGGILNPFKKYSPSDFDEVVIPLDQAQRHPSIVAENRRRASLASANTAVADKNGTAEKKGIEKSGSNGELLTVAQLKDEIEADIASSGHDSAYDRKAKVINKAIQDIGMGRYQWELFCLCGFGWLADVLLTCFISSESMFR